MASRAIRTSLACCVDTDLFLSYFSLFLSPSLTASYLTDNSFLSEWSSLTYIESSDAAVATVNTTQIPALSSQPKGLSFVHSLTVVDFSQLIFHFRFSTKKRKIAPTIFLRLTSAAPKLSSNFFFFNSKKLNSVHFRTEF